MKKRRTRFPQGCSVNGKVRNQLAASLIFQLRFCDSLSEASIKINIATKAF